MAGAAVTIVLSGICVGFWLYRRWNVKTGGHTSPHTQAGRRERIEALQKKRAYIKKSPLSSSGSLQKEDGGAQGKKTDFELIRNPLYSAAAIRLREN